MCQHAPILPDLLVSSIAAVIPNNVDLDDYAAVVLAIYRMGIRASIFSQEIPEIISRAKEMRADA